MHAEQTQGTPDDCENYAFHHELPRESRPESGYVIVGAGKTGMDACLWLLANDVDPHAITWIMPRDSWMLDRASIQPGDFFDRTMDDFSGRTMVHDYQLTTIGNALKSAKLAQACWSRAAGSMLCQPRLRFN